VEQKSSFFQPNVSLDLNVTIPRNLWVSAEQANLELKGELGIRKDYGQNPIVTGFIESIRGTYTFYSKEFTIQKAIVQFQGLPEINPLLDMTTVYKVGETNIFILITGTRKSPIVRLESDDKTLSQDQIVSLLVFGQPIENLNQRESASLQGEAFALLGRVVATQVLGVFGEKLPVDTVQIRASKEGTSTLEVGKYLTRNIFVSFGKEFGQEKGAEQIVVEYYLYSNLTLNAEIRNDQRSGVDLIWKKDF
jgi:translocation and assembly module TamB